MKHTLLARVIALFGAIATTAFLLASCGTPTPASNEILYKTSLNGKWKTLSYDESITAIGKSEEEELCDTIVSIILPNSVVRIDDEAFKNYTALTSIKLPNSLTDIGHRAFEGCKSLTTINIPKGVIGIGYKAFEGCSSLPVIDGIVYADDCLVRVIDTTHTSYKIQEGTRFICNDAFKNCESMTDITLPKGLVMIGIEAFELCKKLTSITLPESVTTIGEKAFAGCWELASINIPKKVQFVGNDLFHGCTSLPVIDGVFYADTYLVGYKSGSRPKATNIKNGTRFIANDAFSDRYRQNDRWTDSYDHSITIPETVEHIGDRAFKNWQYLSSISIPEGVKTIGEEAFYHCTDIDTVTIPSSVTYIENLAFSECEELTTVYCKATTPPELPSSLIFVYYYSESDKIVDEFFDGYYGEDSAKEVGVYTLDDLEAIYVPKESVDAYKNAYGWKVYSEKIVGHDFEE